jgi:hypothetical protein
MKVAVVISTWTGNPPGYLIELCRSLGEYAAGASYDLFLCANGLEYSPPDELIPSFNAIFIRENTGYNLGAWNHAWRQLPHYDRFLFLQDDCVIRRHRWLKDYIKCFESIPKCGLVGETLQRGWGKPWSVLCDPTPMDRKDREPVKRAAQVSFIRDTLAQWGIPKGPTGLHITTVVQFTSRAVLEEVGGYDIGLTKEQAIAAEVGFSRKIEAQGYKLAQIGWRRHGRIGHREWPRNTLFYRLKRSIQKRIVRLQSSFRS